ncbi:hypothetical protein J4E80_003370 [Alternaria sp. BMP 0032]|nr:hypothetical protein J4E80_003370 [Alternaria sp. BMP 0032]
MATTQSRDRTHNPSSGQFAEDTQKPSVSDEISKALRQCDRNSVKLLRRLSEVEKLESEQTQETPPAGAIEAPHLNIPNTLTTNEAQRIIMLVPPKEIFDQCLVLRQWAERNKLYLQDNCRMGRDFVKCKVPEEESKWASSQREKISDVRSAILQVLCFIDNSLNDTMRIAAGPKEWGREWGPGSDWDVEVLKLRHMTNNLSRYNRILWRLTETVGDRGPENYGATAHADGYPREIRGPLDRELRKKNAAKQDARKAAEESRKKELDEESNEECLTGETIPEMLTRRFNERDRELEGKNAGKEGAHNKDLDKSLVEKITAKEEPCTVIWRGRKKDPEEGLSAKSAAKENAGAEVRTHHIEGLDQGLEKWSQADGDASTLVEATQSESPNKVPRQRADLKKKMTQTFRSIIPVSSTKGRKPG